MKKLKKKAYITLAASTIVLVGLSTMLLYKGISFAGEIGTGRIENILTEQKLEKTAKNSVSDNNSIKVGTINLKEQEALYESVKDKINVQKEDSKEILKKYIYNLFGDSINISDSEIWLYKFANENYSWILYVENIKDKKIYWCAQNAMTGECYKLFKFDYTGLDNPTDYGRVTIKDVEIKDSKLNSYITKAEEIVNKNNILNSQNNIREIVLKNKFYIGIRPSVVLNAKMKNGRTAEITFYADTDELVGVATEN